MEVDILDNQYAVIEFDPIDAGQNPSTVTAESAATDNAQVVTVTPVSGQPAQFKVTATGKVGTANVIPSGTNETGGTISGPAVLVNVKATPAVGFAARVITIANQ